MQNTAKQLGLRKLAALVVLAVLFCTPLPALAASTGSDVSASGSDAGTSDVSGSDASDASDSDASDASNAEDEAAQLLAPPGEGLYRPDVMPTAEAFCLMSEDTGLFVAERNADSPLTAASLVKMMTALIAMEQTEKFGWDLDTTMVDSTDKTWIYDAMMEYRQRVGEPSHADIRQGESLSLREIFYATLLPSANEAAMLLADYASTGNLTNFLYMMNTRAKALDCTGTVFVDTCGLSEGNLTTARDMALICRAFMQNATLVQMVGAGTYEIAAHERHNNPYLVHTTNRLMVKSSPYYSAFPKVSGTIWGGKTGSLGEWQNFAGKAVKNGESFICVVMHSPNESDPIAPKVGTLEAPAPRRPALYEAAALFNWAFSSLSVRSTLDTTQPVTELRVRHSVGQDTVKLLPSGDIKTVLPAGLSESIIKRRYTLPDYVEAPVQAGTVLGSVTLYIGSQEIGTVDLMAEKDVERNGTLFMLNSLGDFFSGTYFKVLVGLVLAAGVGYGLLVALVANSRARKKKDAARRPAPAPGKGGARRTGQSTAAPAAGVQVGGLSIQVDDLGRGKRAKRPARKRAAGKKPAAKRRRPPPAGR